MFKPKKRGDYSRVRHGWWRRFLRWRFQNAVAWPFCVGGGALILVFAYGMFIYMGLEGWGALDSFYQTVITLSTVGFEEVYDLSPQAKFHTSMLI